MYLGMLLTYMFMNIFQKYVYLQERKRSEIIRSYKNILHLQKQVEAYPGCQRLFQRGFRFLSSLYSDPRENQTVIFFTKFCDILSFHYPGYQRFFSRLRRSWLRPTAEDVSAFGQHRKFPPHARKTSGAQGIQGFVMKECLRGRLAIACVALQAFDREREGNLGGRPRARSPDKGFA